MKRIIIILGLLLFYNLSLQSQEISMIGVSEIKEMLEKQDDKLYVINFWATWCGPCVTEIPHFEKVAKEYSKEKIEFVLASLDFPSQLEKRLKPFIRKNNISLKVVLIEELDYGRWMGMVDKNWQGNIPVTLFVNNVAGKREFIDRPLDEKELREIIKRLLL